MAELKDKLVNLEDLKVGVNEVCLMQEAVIKKVKSLTKVEYDALVIKDANTLYHITDDASTADIYTKTEINARYSLQTTAPTEAITDGGIHIVHLASAIGVTEYNGYIYMYDED